MAFEKDKNDRAFYQPNAFYIRLKPNDVNSDGGISEEGYLTFIHEFGHLLQDTTTCYGIIDFIHFTDIIQGFVQLVKHGKNKETINVFLAWHLNYPGSIEAQYCEPIEKAVGKYLSEINDEDKRNIWLGTESGQMDSDDVENIHITSIEMELREVLYFETMDEAFAEAEHKRKEI